MGVVSARSGSEGDSPESPGKVPHGDYYVSYMIQSSSESGSLEADIPSQTSVLEIMYY
jgi:hypothetical protein